MAWFRKNQDPLSERERALSQQLSQLESQIKKLDAKVQRNQSSPELQEAALLEEASNYSETQRNARTTAEPIFEQVDQERLKAQAELVPSAHYNEQGLRKYDLPGLFRRIRHHFQGPSTTNPKLVSYLAAGGIQGLRPLRYEKRIARNRLLVSVLFLFLMLLGIILVWRQR